MIRIFSTVKKCILEKRSQSHPSVLSTVAAVFRGLGQRKGWSGRLGLALEKQMEVSLDRAKG